MAFSQRPALLILTAYFHPDLFIGCCMFSSLGRWIVRYWYVVIAVWLAAVIALRWVAPAWDDVTRDGDLAYLPDGLPSVVGERLLTKAFPFDRAKSQIAVFVAREEKPLEPADFSVAYDLARRFENLQGVASFAQARRLLEDANRLQAEGDTDDALRTRKRAKRALQRADEGFSAAIEADDTLNRYWDQHESAERESREAPTPHATADEHRPPPFPAPLFNRSLLKYEMGEDEQAAADRKLAIDIDAKLADQESVLIPPEAKDLPLLDVWTWRDDVFGKKLGRGHKHARVLILQLSNEFMATDNIRILKFVEQQIDPVLAELSAEQRDNLEVRFTGAAAVGGDMLRAAQESIRNTEVVTIFLIVVILGFVYRSPMLIVLPLLTITVSLLAATSAIALLTQVNQLPGFEWWDLKVFTTTRIFIVVILFGAGTDYFLFLVSRYKEELEQGYQHAEAVSRALVAVTDALVASAMTTIVGLSTMFFADFGKYSHSGPVIGLCLVITLLACLTLAPALLRALGRFVFWPFGKSKIHATKDSSESTTLEMPGGWFGWFWVRVANLIVARPGLILVLAVGLMLPVAYHGVRHGQTVTYDFLSQLPPDRPSKVGAEIMRRHFPVGESGPLLVIGYREGANFDTKEGRENVRELSERLYIPGVSSVRTVTDPLGDFPPGKTGGIFSAQLWTKMLTSPHPRTVDLFISTQGEFAGDVIRLDVVMDYDPFSAEAEGVLAALDQHLRELAADKSSFWYGAEFAFAGTTAGIRDLKLVTTSDNRRIQILVVLAVLAVLLVILRRPLICFYMILTVLFSYYVTIGATEWFFAWLYGPAFQGLDWKVPLFLFVILVAIGQDYNVYLATRVFEEQKARGQIEGLRYAVARTGGIITSCGVIMAGTFVSMTSGAWGPYLADRFPAVDFMFGSQYGALPAIVQLGFALSLGVILDTFVVRPILVPAFLALQCRWQIKKDSNETPENPPLQPHQRRSKKTSTASSKPTV